NDGFTDSAPEVVSINVVSSNTPFVSLTSTDQVASEALNADGSTNSANLTITRSVNFKNALPVTLRLAGNAVYGTDFYTDPPLLSTATTNLFTISIPPG